MAQEVLTRVPVLWAQALAKQAWADGTFTAGTQYEFGRRKLTDIAFPGQKVVIRTLDAGSDKPLKFVDHGEEENPALGVRGIRIAEGDPGLLDRQLDAIAAAAEGAAAQPWVMAPMISTTEDTEDFVAMCRERGLEPAGIMVETPSAAITADHRSIDGNSARSAEGRHRSARSKSG